MPWKRKRLPTTVFWPGEFHGLQSMGSQSKTGLSEFHFHTCMHAKLLQSCLFVTLETVAHQAPLSMEFSRQEYWSGLQCPPPRDPSKPGKIFPPSRFGFPQDLFPWLTDGCPLPVPSCDSLSYKSICVVGLGPHPDAFISLITF